MGLFAFLDQLHWYELFGGFIALIVLAIVAFYTFGFGLFLLVYTFYYSAVFRIVAFLGVVGGAGWFIYHLIQKYGA